MVYEVGFKISGWGFCNQKSRVQSHGIRAKGAWSVVWGVWTASQGPPFVGGANRCSLHCHLAKFRGLVIRFKNGAEISRETRFFVCAQLQFLDWALLSQSQRRI